jgi:DNA topoisomerase I
VAHVSNAPKTRRLVIVESPAKAKTIAAYLGPEYVVESSIGHIRDLPERAAEVPESYRDKPWGRLGVDVEHDFEPLYIVEGKKKKVVAELKRHLKDADELLLATDEDREGEAIAWHLVQVLKPKVPVRRMVFHEITKDAIVASLEQTRQIDDRLVDAQETRRILDRLYGYEVSPVLWKKVASGLSAGRVQSVATRLVVERERERMQFVISEYWDIEATLSLPSAPAPFNARLAALDGVRVAQGRDFGQDGRLRSDAVRAVDEATARALAEALHGVPFSVRSVERKPYRRRPAAPFMTSTLQQEASRKLRFAAQTTMRIAQRLYENGYITYMRTDSTTLSETALVAARTQAADLFGADHVSAELRRYDRKVRNAQEAHEAVRPAGDSFRTPDDVKGELSREEHSLYELIWRRTVASQMEDARGETVSVKIAAQANGVGSTEPQESAGAGVAGSGAGKRTDAEFSTAGTVITFRGFLAAYEEGRDEEQSATPEESERLLPPLAEGQALDELGLEPQGHATSPPARYTEATLVRALEELGIGRPSTYASILSTIVDRGYVTKKGSALVPAFVAFSVIQLLEQHFGRLVDYDFTARMEDDLDRIAAGEQERTDWLQRFYYGDAGGAEGNGSPGLKELVSDFGDIDARAVNSIPLGASGIILRVGRYGPFLERGDERASVPPDIAPDELTQEKAEELLARGSSDLSLGAHPETGLEVVVKQGRWGPYVSESLPEGEERKPRTASIPPSIGVDNVTLEQAVQLLSLPRVIGQSEGIDVTATIGRYGPFVQKGEETRSLESEQQVFSITLDEALAVLAQPKTRGRRAAAPPLKELGADPVSGKPVVVKNGRFGAYVTDGETNASLRSSDSVETVTIERAAELLADRRERGPAKKKPARRPAAKKS